MNINQPIPIMLPKIYYNSFVHILYYVTAALLGTFGLFNVYAMYQQGRS